MKELLSEKIRAREVRFGVIGLGYVGLPLAAVFAEAGFRVTGFDVDEGLIESTGRGVSHIEDVSSEALAELVESGAFTATSDFGQLADCDVVSICVPTPLRKTRDPDMSFVAQAAKDVVTRLRRGQLIILESTSYPGSTRELLIPGIESQGLEVGRDVFLAFSPERVDPGRRDWTTRNTPKVVGGITSACLEVATLFYESAIESIVPVSSPEVAELAKIYENTFRAVNIGLANELAMMCDALDLDVWEVIDAASTKPFGFMRFTPGPGLGGHCLPVDPHYLSWKLRSLNYTARFIELASEINTAMPQYWVQKLQDALNDKGKPLSGSRVLVLGVSYKPDVADLREAPSLDIIWLLRQKGANIAYHDPFVPTIGTRDGDPMATKPLESADLTANLVQSVDAVLIVTNHSDVDYQCVAQHASLIVDARGVIRDLVPPTKPTPVIDAVQIANGR